MTREELIRRIRGRAGLAATLAAVGAAGLGAAPALAATDVRITDVDGDRFVVDLDDLESDVESPNGSVEGFTVDNVLGEPQEEVSASPPIFQDAIKRDYRRFEARAGGPPIVLSNRQARSASAYPDGQAMFFVRGGDAAFLRPSSGSGDTGDEVSGAVNVTLSDEPVIEVDVQASDIDVDAGEKVTFTANVTSYSGPAPRIRWNFKDGSSASGTTVRHVFKQDGSYPVLVTASDPGDAATNGSDSVRVEVNPEEKGPDREGGGNRRDEDAPDGGVSDGGRGEGGTGGGNGSGTGAGAGSGAGSGGAASDGAQASDSAQQRARDQAAAGQRVVGELLSGPGTTAATADDGGEEAQPTEARTGFLRETEEPFTVPGVAIGIAALLALLGLGAAAEYERLPRFVRVREKLKGAVAALPGVNG